MGAFAGSPRTADQSDLALFWAGNTALYWNRIASQIATAQNLSVSENAHLFAQLNLAMADAAIACWDAKYRYVFWRPITAIRGGDTDGNDATVVDPNWTPWLDALPPGTPAHPEYPSGHSTVSGAAAFILEAGFGDNTAFTVTSEVPIVKVKTRSFSSFSAATGEIADARVFGGIHYRNSCVQGNAVGRAVADYVQSHAMRFGRDRDEDHR
jgi:membrane-associated phospholipid phosphatase